MSRVEAQHTLTCTTCGAGYPGGTRFCKRDGTSLGALPSDPMIGTLVGGRYVVREKLGEGGMGTVYAAEHTVMRRSVALKVVRDSLASDPTTRARFAREARVAARLVAPEIVQVFDSGMSEDGRLFLAMELLTGETLRERLSRGPLPLAESCRIGAAILRALAVAHAEGVVHRDLKPDNVFLCAAEDAAVKVLDFGIARVLASADETSSMISVTSTGAIVGTALYMSPEAVSRAEVGPAADLYSFGAMLFEALAGVPPFYEEHPVLLMGMHLRVPAPALADKARGPFPPALEALLTRLLAKRPAERPTVAEALAILERLSHAPAPLGPPSIDQPSPRRWSLVLAALLALATAAAGMLVVFAFFGRGLELERPVAQAPERPSPEPPSPGRVIEPAPEPALLASRPETPPPRTMVLRGVFEPASAWAELDGERIALPHEMPADGRTHTLVVQAEGYVPVTRTFVAERDRDVDLALTRRSRIDHHRATAAPVEARPLAPSALPAPRPAGGGLYRQYP